MNFDPEVAAEVGTDAAIILSNIEFWCHKNLHENHNIHDGRAWTYNSHKAWVEYFPYLSESQVKRNLTKLKDSGYILISTHNKANYDRTNWYSSTRLERLVDETKSSNGTDDIGSPIPDNKPDSKQQIGGGIKLSTTRDVLNMYKRLYGLFYGFEPTIPEGKGQKILKPVVDNFGAIQTATMLALYFEWAGADGDDFFVQKRLSSECHPLERFPYYSNAIAASLKNAMGVTTGDDAGKVLDGILKRLSS